jgi:excisionase family DNA binding protein
MLLLREVLIPPVPSVPRSITVGTAARLTGYHPATIRRALQRGDLEGYRAGARGMYRIPPRALQDWLRPAHDPEETP